MRKTKNPANQQKPGVKQVKCGNRPGRYFANALGAPGRGGEGHTPTWFYQPDSVSKLRHFWRACLRVCCCVALPRFWLQRLHRMRRFCCVLSPPRAHGVMWSASGLLGWSVVPHASAWWQCGQWVCPWFCARVLAVWLACFQAVVPVLEVATVPPDVCGAGRCGVGLPRILVHN